MLSSSTIGDSFYLFLINPGLASLPHTLFSSSWDC
jgi:hypothetical protein